MDKNNTYFFISGLISLSLFTFIITLFFYILLSKSDIKTFALNKDNYISVSLEFPKEKKIESKKKSNIITPTIDESKDINIGELFSDVWTKKINQKEKKEVKKINNRLQDALSKSKKLEKKEFSTKPKNEKIVTSSGNEVNEYLAKIQALVYENFYPPQNSQGHSVKAVIELDALGVVKDFRILTYSKNSVLNIECDRIKNRLLNKLFPVNPENISGSFVIILTSKE